MLRAVLPILGASDLGPLSASSRYTVVPSWRSRGCALGLRGRVAGMPFDVVVAGVLFPLAFFVSSLSSSLSESRNSSGSSLDAAFGGRCALSACSASAASAAAAASVSALSRASSAAASSRALRASACDLRRASFSWRLRFSSAARLVG